MAQPDDKTLREAAGRWLRGAERDLDELTVARLRAARRRALAAEPRRYPPFAWGGGLAAAAVALGLAAVVWFNAPLDVRVPPAAEINTADLDLLAIENPEFYSELEFYRWLASQAESG